MDDVIAFLEVRLSDREQQLAEDERVALAGNRGPWVLDTFPAVGGIAANVLMPLGDSGAKTGLTTSALLGTQDARTTEHVARHDPVRVLAEVERGRREIAAVRAILERFRLWFREQTAAWEHYSDWIEGKASAKIPQRVTVEHEGVGLKLTIRLLANVCAGHPDWCPEWLGPSHVPTNEVMPWHDH